MSDLPHVDSEDATLISEIERLLGVDLPSQSHLGLAPTSTTPDVPTAGRLGDVDFVRLIGLAFSTAYSGTLIVRSHLGEATIWLSAGLPQDVVLPGETDRGRATAAANDVERWFFEVAAWDEGDFAFAPATLADNRHRVHPLRHPVVLAYEVLQRRTDVSALELWRGDRRNRFQLRWPFAAQVLTNLPLDLRNPLRLFDGGRSFAEVQRGTRCDESTLLCATYLLFCFDALDMGTNDSPIIGLNVVDRTDRAYIEALFNLAEESDYFAFLGVDRMSSQHELAQAMARIGRAIADQKLHPDVALATGRQRSIIATVLDEARRLLLNEALRVRYRAALGPEP